MKVQEIFDLAIKLGIKNDLRGEKRVLALLKKVKDKYEKLSVVEKKKFYQKRLTNPYLDTQILHNSGKDVKKVYVGIDIDTAELLLAKQMGDIDLVMAHHPTGEGLINLHDVMALQVEVLANYGVPINVAQGCFHLRIDEVARGVNPSNHFKSSDAAKHLDMSFMCCHTICDNLVATFLRKNIDGKKFEYVSEILEFLKTIPEYEAAEEVGVGPRLFAGRESNYCGRIAVTEITGGTEGSPNIYESLSQAGIGTVIGMHMSEEHKKQAEKYHVNALIAGHMSSDSIGVNLFLDELEKRGVKVVTGSGVFRVKRTK